MDVKRSCKRKSNEKERLRSSTHKKKKSGHKQKSRYSDSTETSTDTNSSTSNVEAYRQKHKSVKHISKHKRKKSKHDDLGKTASKKKKHKKKSCEIESSEISQKDIAAVSNNDIGPMPLQASKAMAPMTKEEWEKQQSIVRRVYDPETGRNRLIKGDGEILEEIVSKERHKEINKTATINDGEYFKAKMGL